MYLISWEEGVEGPKVFLLAKKIKSRPRQDKDSPDGMNFMDLICIFQEEQVTQE